jgi:small-conductance mechanosensitive channel
VRTLTVLLLTLAAIACGTPGMTRAEPAPLAAATATADSVPQAGFPVVLDGREVFRIQATIKSHTPDERARVISDRLLRMAKDRSASVDSIQVSDSDISSDVGLGERILFSVFDVDAQAANRDRMSLAREQTAATKAAIDDFRARYAAKSIFTGVIGALVATFVLLVLLWLLARLLRRTIAAIDSWVELKQDRIREKSKTMVPPEQVRTGLRGLARLARLLLVLVVLYVYVNVVLGLFPWTQRLAGNLLGLLLRPLQAFAVAAWGRLPGLIFIAILALVTRYVLRLARFGFEEIAAGRISISGFYPDWAKPTYNIVRILIVLLAVVVAYPYIPGSDTEAFKGVSLFLGVLVSLGSTSAVANIVAGIILTYMRAFRVGDVIEVGGQRGIVTEMSLLATHVRTAKNVSVTIPNGTVLGSHVTNFSSHAADRGLIVHTTVGIGYDVPWRQVHAMLLNAAAQTKGLLMKPAPFVLQRSLDDSCVRYELNAYTDRPELMLQVYSDLHKRVLDAFNEYGVQIMTPSYEGDREVPAVVPKENWYAAPAKRPGEPGADE